ncbi:unnamed protein product [Closterium sp. NIES-53]
MDHSEGETPSPVLPMTNVSYSRSTTETEPYVPTDAEDMLDVAISVLDPRLAHQASSSPSTPRSAGRNRQVHLSFASPPPDTRKRARCVPPPPTAEEVEERDNAIAEDAEVPPDTQIPDAERSLARRFSTSWKQTYSWLSLKYNKQERQYGMKCSVCCKFAPNTKSPLIRMARRFAQRLIKALGKRMADLRHFDGVGFFSPDKYPDRAGEQDAWVKLHLTELLDMFKNQLPGVALADIEPQMRLFTATMEKKFKKQSFHQALTNMVRTADWRDDYPTIVSLWRAVSVLPLSTVECERGFSRQNIIKSWDRVALTDVRLGELMTVKMLDYPVDRAAAYALFEEKGRKGRKLAK